MQVHIIRMELSNSIMLPSLMMLLDMGHLDNMKCALTTKLCLLLLLAPPHHPRGYENPPTPAPFTTPSTRHPPAPQQPPPPSAPPQPQPQPHEHLNSHPKPVPGKEGTGEKTLVLQQPPTPGKRSRDDDPGLEPGPADGKRAPQGPKKPAVPDPDPDPLPEDPEGPEDLSQPPEIPAPAPREPAGAEGGEGEVEGHPHPPPPPPVNGKEGAAGQGGESLFLQGLASRLTRWDQEYKQLVDDILDDLEGYWRRLAILQ